MEIILYEPHDKQKILHNYCDLSSPNFWTICVSGRQAGKSWAGQNQAIYWSLSDPDTLTWYVCPTDEQCMKVYHDILKATEGSGLIKKNKGSKGSIIIQWKNGSKIEFRSAESKSLRGNTVHYLIIDEAAFIKENRIEEEIMGTIMTSGKKGLIISTPKGKNWFYNWFLLGLDNNSPDYRSLKFISTDNPKAKLHLIEMAKSRVSAELFQQEYLGEFVDSAAVFKYIDELATLNLSEPIKNEVYHAGIDIGMLKDDTVMTILDNTGKMVYYDAFTKLEAPEIKERLLRTLKKWNPISALIELNNQGLPIYQLLVREFPNLKGFNTTNSSKEEIINNLIAAFSSKEIRIINDDFIKLQLQAFIFEMTATGKVKYLAASGFHDDAVMSLAIAWEAFVKNKAGSRYMMMGSAETPSNESFFNEPNQLNTGNYMIMGGIKPNRET